MAFIPKRIFYEDFPDSGFYGITNREALELAIEGSIPAYYQIAVGFNLVGASMVGPQYIVGSYGSYHGPTAQLPMGKLTYLEAQGNMLFDSANGIQVEGFYHREFGPTDEPTGIREAFEAEEFFWLFLEKGETFEMLRSRIIFMREDLERLAQHMNRQPSDGQSSESDAALGAVTRQRLQMFAARQREAQSAREIEYERWRKAANEIQQSRQNPASKRQLAGLVKSKLNLPDCVETIRKKL
ncbi:MAG: hypothetical protein ACK561_17895 [Pseudomonadaceae bacterium]